VDILAKAGEVDSKLAQAIAKYTAETKAGVQARNCLIERLSWGKTRLMCRRTVDLLDRSTPI
jgi:hypothetical protein